jgi:triphosphoribosyl-dephospho-CoA synthase
MCALRAAASVFHPETRDTPAAEAIGALAARCLALEINTFPKPGLVSHRDCGSHADMNAATFARSGAALAPFFADLAAAGARGARMAQLRAIGVAAEAAMLKVTGGVNTHRGAIFGLGLLCAAAGAQADLTLPLPSVVAFLWGRDILSGPRPADSHGALAERRYGAGGARQEAANGFPHLVGVGLPALQSGLRLAAADPEAARVQCCFALIATLDDTNLLHRGGEEGLAFAQAAAQGFLQAGGVGQVAWRTAAATIHRAFVARRLSPGGAADMLAMSLFVEAWHGAMPLRA